MAKEPHHSYTELEFEEARRLGLPVLAFLLADDVTLPLGETKYAKRQKKFRKRLVSELTVTYFRNPDQLGNLIGEGLRDLDILI